MPSSTSLEGVYRAQRRRIFGLAYRLTGSAEDAEDVVQEAFSRLLAQEPGMPAERTGPWLVRVATNLGIDALRRRRRRAYAGPWLPSPLDSSGTDWAETARSEEPDPEARYGLVESATYAFLVALEALRPRPRAVLLLRDALGYSASETAAIVGVTEGNVRILHLRARRALAAYDAGRALPAQELVARHRDALRQLLEGLQSQDAGRLEAILSGSVRTITDAGGAYAALATPLAGRARVVRLYLTAAANRRAAGMSISFRPVNGLPALEIVLARPLRRQAPRSILRCELDAEGRIEVVHAILAPRKLAGLPPA